MGMMMESIMKNLTAIIVVLGNNSKPHLIVDSGDQSGIHLIIRLLTPFKVCGEKLSSENNVTISLIVPRFERLKLHLAADPQDTKMIADMKKHMLAKLKTRYSSDQMKILK